MKAVDIPGLLQRYGIRPSKGLGQNFLVAEWVYDRILQVCEIRTPDVVLEVGPGLGTLTRRLAERAGGVVAVELDRKMLPILQDYLAGMAHVHIVQGDILEVDPVALLCCQLAIDEERLAYHVVANLPYYITSNALRHLLGARVRPQRLTLMVQREVAERIVAGPGQMSLLSVSVQVFGQPEFVCSVPPSAFTPRPAVFSAVLHIRVFPQPLAPEGELERFFAVARAGFGQKRKQLHNGLMTGLGLPAPVVLRALEGAAIDPKSRPQNLAVADWARLTAQLADSLPFQRQLARA